MVINLMSRVIMIVALLCAWAPTSHGATGLQNQSDRIQPYAGNPRYWQYQGRPVVLLGGSKDDNLFQLPDLEEHLKLLASVGGNYVRNTMSARDPGNVQPFAKRSDGRYDLERWNDEYWERLERLLHLARESGIIVQIEVWDRFDYSRKPWQAQPFNPQNNINYTSARSGLTQSYREHPARNRQPFFFTTPKQQNNTLVLRYQQRFVDELLRRSLPYANVLYCIDNETGADETWGAYWASYIRERARTAGVRVFVTEMWDDWDLRGAHHRRTLDHPERYDFVEVSQNNHQRGENHWNNLQWAWRYLEAEPRPMNAVKTYGADTPASRTDLAGGEQWWRRLMNRPGGTDTPGDYGDNRHGAERWWRQLIGGVAAVRFHRPDAGIGLNREAQQHLRSARMFLAEFDIVRAVPDAEHTLLSRRGENEAYLTQIAGEAYAVYFPQGGEVRLRVQAQQRYSVKWLDIAGGRWHMESTVDGNEPLALEAPQDGHWLALVRRETR